VLVDFMAFVFGQVYHYMTMGIEQDIPLLKDEIEPPPRKLAPTRRGND
jgi:hypothetical protein